MPPEHTLIIFKGEGKLELELVERPDDASDSSYMDAAKDARVKRLIELNSMGLRANVHIVTCAASSADEFRGQVALAEQLEAEGGELPSTQEVLASLTE